MKTTPLSTPVLKISAAFLAIIIALGSVCAGAAQDANPERWRSDIPTSSTPRLHDPSTIAQCGKEYWTFATGRGVRSFRSKDLVAWQPGPPVFANAPAWTRQIVPENRGFFWAPDVLRVHQRYLLYYSVSSWGKNTSAIGLASNATLDPADPAFQWKDEGIVIRSTATNNFNAIDPAVTLDAEGRLWLAFGSFWSGIKLVQLDSATGKCITPDAPLYSLAHHASIEAPFLHRRGSQYYLFVNWGLCCRGTNSTYEIRVGRSSNLTGPYLDKNGMDLLRGGGTPVLGSRGDFIGPGHPGIVNHAGQDWLSCHFYDGRQRGQSVLALRKLGWSEDGWPVVSDQQPPREAP